MKDFFAWLEWAGRMLRSPYGARELPRRVLPARLPAVLTAEEAIRVLESASPRTSQGLCDRAMLEILYSTGMRKGELVALNVADFSFERQELVRTVGQIVGRAAKRSGVAKTITPHTFRRSMATQMLRTHADPRHSKAILGHARITNTELYTHVFTEGLDGGGEKGSPPCAERPMNLKESRVWTMYGFEDILETEVLGYGEE